MKLSAKTILTTGGTSGIGLELARQLLKRRNTVIVTGRDQHKLDQVQEALPGVYGFQSDVSDPVAIEGLRAQVLHQFPTLDVLVNNAGIMRNLNLNDERTLVDVTREIEVNLAGPVRMMQSFLPHLKTRKGALIVNVTSGLAFVPLPLSPVYCATKAAMHSFSQSMRAQLAGTSVTIVELAPPATETPLLRGEFEKEYQGQKAMSVETLVAKTIAGIESGTLEIRPGLSNILKIMSRLAPNFMFKQLAKVGQSYPATSTT